MPNAPTRKLATLVAAAACLAGSALAANAAPGAKPHARACLPALWTNPPHTATTNFGFAAPQLSLLAANLASVGRGKVLEARLTVGNLTESVPPGATAEDWYLTWLYKGTTYFASSQLSAVPGSTPSFADGSLVKVGTSTEYQQVNTDTGTFLPGPNGVVVINVPLANVGHPASGAVLASPAGATFTELGTPPNPTGKGVGSLQSVDSGGPGRNYTVGTTSGTCK
ncbi:MAG: hypothetical protein ACYDB7_01985 [Mycobacteriales bacterium]